MAYLAPYANAALPPTSYFLRLCLHHRLMFLAVFLYLLLSLLPDSLKVLQWNAGGLQSKSTELLHFISFHLVDLICIQKSNLNSSSSFRIPGFSALRSDCTHYRSGILSPDTTHAGGGVIIFIQAGLILLWASYLLSFFAWPLLSLCRGQHLSKQFLLVIP